MKKIIFKLLLLNTLVFCSCNELDVYPDSSLSSGTFWRDSNDAIMASTGVYGAWSSAHTYQIFFADAWSDDAIPTGFWHAFYYFGWGQGNISPQNNDLNGFWSSLYTVIRSANVFLANVNKCSMDETKKNQLIGEIKFIRAYEYLLLYNTWGEVPLIDKPLTVTDDLKIPRPSGGSTVAFILKDLTDAANSLPVVAAETGRVTKGAALALKARVLLYNEQYNDAAATAKAVMDLNQYKLLRTASGDGFYQLRNTYHSNNQEEIMGFQFDGVNSANDVPGWLNSLNGGYLLSPTKALVDAFDGYNKQTDQKVAIDESTTASAFSNRDPRLDWSVAHTGTVSQVDGTTLNSESGILSAQSTGYGCLKFVNKWILSNDPKPAGDNILIRYAEVLLTYAEAKIEANSIDQSVLDAINEVRSRAYGTTKEDVSHYPEVTTTNQSILRSEVRKERRVELAFEGLRWFDIKRWKIACGSGGTMNGIVWGAKKADGSYFNAGTRDKNADRDYLRPIPQQQIDLQGKDILVQNSGYN